MVINITALKNQDYDLVQNEIAEIKQAIGDKILKVIVETCFLTEDEKVKVCELVTNAKADYIKTSTGFGTAGATIADIRLFKANIGPDVKMKAAGGVKSVEDLIAFINEGCARIGTSSAVKMLKGEAVSGY
jgi:deoxyribose-phosphate aldolase